MLLWRKSVRPGRNTDCRFVGRQVRLTRDSRTLEYETPTCIMHQMSATNSSLSSPCRPCALVPSHQRSHTRLRGDGWLRDPAAALLRVVLALSLPLESISQSCQRMGWYSGSNAGSACPSGTRLPSGSGEYSVISPCILASDQSMFSYYQDIAVSVGG